MANFTLNWTPNITPNVTAQRALRRQKSVGGAFSSVGFTPANDLPTSANTVASNGLLDNVVYEFQIANICDLGGPTTNSNSIQEAIKFACVTPVASAVTYENATVTVSGLPVDIVSVEFTLKNAAGSTTIQSPVVIPTSGGAASKTFLVLTASTTYRAYIELLAVVQGVTVKSSLTCFVSFATTATPDCIAPTALAIT